MPLALGLHTLHTCLQAFGRGLKITYTTFGAPVVSVLRTITWTAVAALGGALVTTGTMLHGILTPVLGASMALATSVTDALMTAARAAAEVLPALWYAVMRCLGASDGHPGAPTQTAREAGGYVPL